MDFSNKKAIDFFGEEIVEKLERQHQDDYPTYYQKIHCYQILRGNIDIFTQMVNGRTFDEEYLKGAIKW